MRSPNAPGLILSRSHPAKLGCLAGSRWVDLPISSTLWSSMLVSSRQQTASDHKQVRQRACHLQSVQILRQSPIPNLRKSEQSFDHPEGMFHSGADLQLGSVLAAFGIVDLTVVAVALVRKVLCSRCTLLSILQRDGVLRGARPRSNRTTTDQLPLADSGQVPPVVP